MAATRKKDRLAALDKAVAAANKPDADRLKAELLAANTVLLAARGERTKADLEAALLVGCPDDKKPADYSAAITAAREKLGKAFDAELEAVKVVLEKTLALSGLGYEGKRLLEALDIETEEVADHKDDKPEEPAVSKAQKKSSGLGARLVDGLKTLEKATRRPE